MCGIAGIYDRTDPPGADELTAMADCLRHRGPDEDGRYQDGPVGFAHRRLSIVDLATGRQPIANEDGSVVVIFNGEIYNYQSLRDSLSRAGHEFATDTDTEVLVHLYEEDGPQFVEGLEGMYAFALWDTERERLLLARDPMGIKPLVLGVADDRLAFGSELSAVLAADFDHGGLDRGGLARYFALGFIPAPYTAFRNVRKLRPGECVVVADGERERTVRRPTLSARSPGFDAAASELRDRVEAAVEKRLQGDVPLGALLSGGLDSAIVTGTMSRLRDDPVQTFSVGFESERFDESDAARAVAEHFDTDHHEYVVSPADVRELVPEVVGGLDEPFADQSLLPTTVVARETSDAVTVALSGDGADELFAGYDRYRGEYFSRYYRAVPAPVRRRVIEPTVERLPASRASATGEFARKLQKFTGGGVEDVADRHLRWARIADETTAGAVPGLDPLGSAREDLAAVHEEVERDLPASRRDGVRRVQAVETQYTLPNQMLRKVDRASMANSLEVRVPFLDRDVVEYALSLPTEYVLTPRSRKRVLRAAFADDLPRRTLRRRKQGFDMPIGEWFRGPLADAFHEAVAAVDTPLLDTDAVAAIYDEHCAGSRDHGKFLWAVYVFAVWYRRMSDEGVLSG